MIGVNVRFQYEDSFDRARVIGVADNARATFEGMPGLRFKFFTLDEPVVLQETPHFLLRPATPVSRDAGKVVRVPRAVRADARLAAAHIVKESRAVTGGLLEASGASAHFLSSPLQRAKRDVDVISGHIVFDYDVSRELASALAIGLKISPIAMV